MQPFFANQSCDAFTPESRPCLLGNYVSYAVNVSCTADVSAALAFATKNNIRVVVRNTGHEYAKPHLTCVSVASSTDCLSLASLAALPVLAPWASGPTT